MREGGRRGEGEGQREGLGRGGDQGRRKGGPGQCVFVWWRAAHGARCVLVERGQEGGWELGRGEGGRGRGREGRGGMGMERACPS